MINIGERPAEVEDRAVPGHWEGDLIIGKQNQPRDRHPGRTLKPATRCCCTCPRATSPSRSATRSPRRSAPCPTRCAVSLTWDQGPEMRDWKQVSIDADIDIYFCDPHSPWQRGTNENTNGLLRQYFPKGTDLSCTAAEDLDGSPMSSTTDPAND